MEVVLSLPKIYKRSNTAAILSWFMEIGTDGTNWGHRVVSGQIDGAKTRSGWTICKPKNVGKANETTAKDQTISEVDAQYKIKLKRGYHESIDDVDKIGAVKPMLANKWEDRKHKVDVSAGVYVQPKLDGIRCIATAEGLHTRTGEPIVSVPHIESALDPIFQHDPSLILDGELYNDILRDDFNTITSIVRKQKPTNTDLKKAEQLIEYHMYDHTRAGIGKDETPFSERIKTVMSIVIRAQSPYIHHVKTHYVTDHETLDELYGKFIESGKEGQIVRLDKPYEKNKRSHFLLKRKEFDTDEFPVIAMNEGEGNWAGYVKTFDALLPDGRDFSATLRGNQKDLAELLKNGMVPKWATVRFFGYTPAGKPRFPVAIDWGFDETRKD